jgi:hypothetical protein
MRKKIEELSFVSKQMMIHRRFRDNNTKHSNVKDKQKRTKNGILRKPIQKLKNRIRNFLNLDIEEL